MKDNYGKQIPYTLMDISPGKAGTEETLSLMRQMAIHGSKDPRLRGLGIRIISSISPRDNRQRAGAILLWCQEKIEYVRDIRRVETLQTPQRTLLWRAGDCDDFSILISSILLSVGFNNICFVAQKSESYGPFRHVFVCVFVDGEWYKMDGTSKKPIHRMPWDSQIHIAMMV